MIKFVVGAPLVGALPVDVHQMGDESESGNHKGLPQQRIK
jgi:hypothetical protein